MDNTRHEKISPTAWATAHARTFTDIPYSQEIFDLLEQKRRDLGEQDLSVRMKDTSISLIIESRYKMIDKFLIENSAKQILEIASGLTQRGLITTGDPSIIYVEMDLPTIIREKREMIENIEGRHRIKRNNLFFESGNALDLEDVENAAKYFDRKKPLVVINEGLLRYLNFDEKAIVAKNIKALLQESGGYWVTPDVSTKRSTLGNNSRQRQKFNIQVEKTTGVTIENNLFKDKEHAVKFFEDLGFDVEQRSYIEIKDKLVCPKRVDISQEEIDDMTKNSILLVMKVRPNK